MNAMTIDYKELSGMALIAIFTLADSLGIPPKKAAVMILKDEAEIQLSKPAA